MWGAAQGHPGARLDSRVGAKLKGGCYRRTRTLGHHGGGLCAQQVAFVPQFPHGRAVQGSVWEGESCRRCLAGALLCFHICVSKSPWPCPTQSRPCWLLAQMQSWGQSSGPAPRLQLGHAQCRRQQAVGSPKAPPCPVCCSPAPSVLWAVIQAALGAARPPLPAGGGGGPSLWCPHVRPWGHVEPEGPGMAPPCTRVCTPAGACGSGACAGGWRWCRGWGRLSGPGRAGVRPLGKDDSLVCVRCTVSSCARL